MGTMRSSLSLALVTLAQFKRMRLFQIAGLVAAVAAAALLWAPGRSAGSSDIVVAPGFVVRAADGQCSLMEALDNANLPAGGQSSNDCAPGIAGADTISLAAGATYSVTDLENTQYGRNGLPAITSTIIIEGNGAMIERADFATDFRLFFNQGDLTLDGVVLRGGLARGGDGAARSPDERFGGGGGGGGGFGGSIYNFGSLTVLNSTLMENTAQGGDGSDGGTYGTGGGGGGLGGDGGAGWFEYFSDYVPTSGGGGGGTSGDGAPGTDAAGGMGGNATGGGGGTAVGGNGSGGGSGGGGGGGGLGDFDTAGGNGGPGGEGGGGGGGVSAFSGGTGGNGGNGGWGGGGGGGGGASNLDVGGNGGNGGFGGGAGTGGFGSPTHGQPGTPGPFGGASAPSQGGAGGGAGLGGAIFNDGGLVTIANSTFSQNSASGGEGGVPREAFGTTGAPGTGAGGAVFTVNGAVNINNATLADNSADSGGGFYAFGYGTIVNASIYNTIIAGSPASDCTASQNLGDFTIISQNNLMANPGNCGADILADPQLGPLQLNAPGLTPTYAISPGSPAIDSASALVNGASAPSGACEATDQRGVQRPQDGDGDTEAICDIGSYEYFVPATPTPTPITSPTPSSTATTETATPTATGTPTATATPTPTATPSGTTLIWGDDNCSGNADPVDALITLRYDAGLSTNTGSCPEMGTSLDVAIADVRTWGDVDCSGAANPVDALKLLRYDAALSVATPVGCPEIGSEVVVSG